MPTITEVAKAAGVSVSTVSRALRGLPDVSPETRQRVEEIAAKLSYAPSAHAAAMASGKAMAVNVLVPFMEGWFTSRVIDGIDETLREMDQDVILYRVGNEGALRERVLERSLSRRRGDAVIAVCMDFSSAERAHLEAVGLPTVVVGGPVEDLPYVGVDEELVGYTATRHLLDLGHRRILHITGGRERENQLNPAVPAGRLAGYDRAMGEAGIDDRPVLEGGFSLHQSRHAMEEYLGSGAPVPAAVFAASDEMAIGVILALQDRGLRVPQDVSVVGVDDHPLAVELNLTTVRQDPFEEGLVSARMALQDPAQHASVVLATQLVTRGSTAPA